MSRGLRDLLLELRGVTWLGLGLVAAIAVAAWVIVRLRARYRDNEDPAGSDQGMLLHVGELHRQGHLSEEEYRSIKGRLVRRLDGSLRAHERQERPNLERNRGAIAADRGLPAADPERQ